MKRRLLVFSALALTLLVLSAQPAIARRRRKVRKDDPLKDHSRVCVTSDQFRSLARFPIKQGCLVPVDKSHYCAPKECATPLLLGDFDGDGKSDHAFGILMNEPAAGKANDAWGIFAILTSNGQVVRANFKSHPKPESKYFLQPRLTDEEGNKYPGWVLVVAEEDHREALGLDATKRRFIPSDTLTHYEEGDPNFGFPGYGISVVGGLLFVAPSNGGPGGVGAQFGGRLDGYATRYFSLNTGVTYAFDQNYSDLEFPMEGRFWVHPQFYLGGGAAVVSVQSGATGAPTAQNTSSLNWLGSIGYKSRINQSRFYLFWDLDVMGNGSGVNFHSYGGLRYGFLAE